MGAISVQPVQGTMVAAIAEVPAFPGGRFTLGYPEAVGDAARPEWPPAFAPRWEEADGGAWVCRAVKEGEVEYSLAVEPHERYVDAVYTMKNLSPRRWERGMAFNCFQCGSVPEIRDHECLRHWVRADGVFRRLIDLPRQYGPRPTVQLYSVEGAPPGSQIPFVANFGATPAPTLEGWMAIVSRDGRRLVATVSRPSLFLFQNMEYSCIHSGNDFGPLEPGATAEARNRTYFVESQLEDWYREMQSEVMA